MFVFIKQTTGPGYLIFCRKCPLFDVRELIRCQMKLAEGEITDYKLGFKQTERAEQHTTLNKRSINESYRPPHM